MKRLHVSLEDDVHMAAKLFSTYMNLTVNELMSSAIIYYLRNQQDHQVNEHLVAEIERLTADQKRGL